MNAERDDTLQATLSRAGLPTADEVAVRDRRARERRVAEDKQTERFEAYQRKHAPPPPPTDAERREFAVRGLERLARQLRGRDVEHVHKLLDEARDHLQKHTVAKAELAELESPQTILREHAATVAGKLMKNIGGFVDENEAIGFVLRFWPITAARVEAAKMTNLQSKLGRSANHALKGFWSAIERGACLATNKPSNEALRECVRAGQL